MLGCRYLKNGWEVTTKAPNKGLASQLKKIIMQSAKKVNGGSLHFLAPTLTIPAKCSFERANKCTVEQRCIWTLASR